jgi:hypothetical protein
MSLQDALAILNSTCLGFLMFILSNILKDIRELRANLTGIAPKVAALEALQKNQF